MFNYNSHDHHLPPNIRANKFRPIEREQNAHLVSHGMFGQGAYEKPALRQNQKNYLLINQKAQKVNAFINVL